MWINVKEFEKKEDKDFYKEVKIFQPKTTLHLPTSLQLYIEQICSTAQTVVPQTLNHNETPSTAWINITKNVMK